MLLNGPQAWVSHAGKQALLTKTEGPVKNLEHSGIGNRRNISPHVDGNCTRRIKQIKYLRTLESPAGLKLPREALDGKLY